MTKHLHIVTHDVPFPADFGGVVDLYYKIKWLHQFGVKIHLHCFVKNRPPQSELNKYCDEVLYYQRKISGVSFSLPYIVSSRTSPELLRNLQKDDHPILLEGIHCTYHLFSGALKGRKVFLRLHNVEYNYYGQLAKYESNLLKKIYFKNEARLLKKYESAIAEKAPVWTVSASDADLYRAEFGTEKIYFLPVFLPWDDVTVKPGTGAYCLYHGNLSVNENEKAALWLMENVFSKTNIPLIIAGRSPSKKLLHAAESLTNVSIHADPFEAEMQELIENAAVNVLPSFNRTGVKLKLLNALYNGRHCIVNAAGSEGSGLEEVCETAETPQQLLEKITALFSQPVAEIKIESRRAALKDLYNNEQSTRRINGWIW